MGGFWRLLSYFKNYKRPVLLSILSNILLSIFTVVSIPLIIPFFQILFDRAPKVTAYPEGNDIGDHLNYQFSQIITNHGQEKALTYVCLTIVGVFFLKNLFRYLALMFMAPVRNGIVRDIRKGLFYKLLDLPMSYYSNKRKGDLMSRITSDVQEIEWSVLNVIEAIFKSPIVIIGSIGFMLYVSPILTLFVFVLIIFTGGVIGGISRTLKQSSEKAQGRLGRITSIVEESLSGLRIIKGFKAESYQKDKFDQENESYKSILTRILWRRDLSSPLSEFLGVMIVTVLLWYGSRLVFDTALAPETFFAFLFAFFQVIEPSKSFSSAYYNIQKGLAALDRVDSLLFAQNTIKDGLQAQSFDAFNKDITFDNMSFRYEEGQEWVLKNINLHIPKGSIMALVGSSGAGKSTLVDLLPRFYDITEGQILIDGIPIQSIKLNDLRALFGIVSQDAILFNDTIENNIRFGFEASEEEVKAAALIANAHEFIKDLPEGYQTNIGDRGMKLSGGQRQRITIARAVLRNPAILILDEATSALDSESEQLVKEALEKIMIGRTSIVIAHRLSTIKHADRIIVLEGGKIVEEGNHNDLMDKAGAYQRFVEMQTFQ